MVRLAPWWLVFLEGLVALIIGIYLMINPRSTITFLMLVLGIYWLITGILTLVHLLIDRTDLTWKLISGILGILAGVVVIEYPILSALIVPGTFVLLVGILGIWYGAMSLYYSLKLGWGAAIKGMLSIILGVLLVGYPIIGIALLVYFLAAIEIIGGAVTMYLGYKMRRIRNRLSRLA